MRITYQAIDTARTRAVTMGDIANLERFHADPNGKSRLNNSKFKMGSFKTNLTFAFWSFEFRASNIFHPY